MKSQQGACQQQVTSCASRQQQQQQLQQQTGVCTNQETGQPTFNPQQEKCCGCGDVNAESATTFPGSSPFSDACSAVVAACTFSCADACSLLSCPYPSPASLFSVLPMLQQPAPPLLPGCCSSTDLQVDIRQLAIKHLPSGAVNHLNADLCTTASQHPAQHPHRKTHRALLPA